jgi:tRNA-specific 2-thiouridylase
MCNREIKFGVLRQWALDQGFSAVATGHYARRAILLPAPRQSMIDVSPGIGGEHFALLEGADPNKDQSYFLAMLSQSQLRDARFPIGDLLKPELRALARRAGLATADKKDSQGICFIGQVKMADFLRAYVPDAPGPVIRADDGRVLGEHRGLHFFTLGQRKGIGVPSNTDNKAYVVVGKRAPDRALLVAFDEVSAPGLFTTEVTVHGIRWNTPTSAHFGPAAVALEARVRYRDPRVPIVFTPASPDSARVAFASPQRGLASGQVIAFYEGARLIGGGIYA